MKSKLKSGSHMWTKEELKTLMTLWDTMSIQELEDELNLNRSQISSMARRIRQAGYKLTKKNKTGYIEGLIKDVIFELAGKEGSKNRR